MHILLRIFEMAIGNIFVSVSTIKLYSHLKSKSGYLNLAIFGFLWIYVTTFFTLILGISGFLDSHKIAIISGIGIILIIIPELRKVSRYSPSVYIRSYLLGHKYLGYEYNCRVGIAHHSNCKATINWWAMPTLLGKHLSLHVFSLFRRIWHIRPGVVPIMLVFLALIQLARIIIHIWYIPPYVWDTVVYHLVNVAEWVQKGRIFPVVTPVGRVYWPASFEVFTSWFVVFLHNDLLIKTAPFICYIVTGLSAYAIARALGLSCKLSASAAIFYVFTPSLAIQATACKNDVGISAVYLFSIAILVNLLRNGPSQDLPLRNQILLVVMAMCLGISIKPYMMFIAIAPILIGAIALWKYRKALKLRQKAQLKVPFILLLASSLFIGLYWYARNFAVFDNPFHPTDFRIGDHLIFGTGDAVQFGPGQRGSASLTVMWENLRLFIKERIFDKSGEYSSHLSNMSGWGWFSFSCGIPALAYALVFVRQLRILIILFILSLISLFTFITNDPWYMRFTLWFPIVFALSFACLISNLSYKWLRGIFMSLGILCALLNWIAVLNVGEISVDDFKRMMNLSPLHRSTAELTNHYEGAFKKALQIIPKDEVTGFCFPNNGWAYPLYDSDYSRHLVYVPIEDTGFTRYMRDQGIHYLFIERITPEQTALIQKAVEEGSLTKIEEFLFRFSLHEHS